MTYFEDIMHQLILCKVESPRLETRLLFAAATKREPSKVFPDIILNENERKQMESMLKQRLKHKPLDKILGHREFYKANFTVNTDVLSPRPDTEILVEKALQYMPENRCNVLDLGTGSGCIIESLLMEKTDAVGTAVDISEKSLNIARKNAENLKISERIKFVCADWFNDDIIEKLGQKYDIIVSNPPYIPTGEISKLEPEVKNYDPMVALDGGTDGLDSYRRIATIIRELLKKDGFILLEAGIGQATQIADIFIAQKLKPVEIVADLNNIPRCVILQK